MMLLSIVEMVAGLLPSRPGGFVFEWHRPLSLPLLIMLLVENTHTALLAV